VTLCVQLKQVIADVVTEAMTYLDQLPTKADRAELIATLRTVTDGKVRPALPWAYHARLLYLYMVGAN
jgi:hypothetical protein